jgi:membrane-bound lytic murein transglycosylase F
MFRAHVRVLSALLLSAFFVTACELVEPEVERDWDAIVERDTLIAVMPFNSTSYFVYRGKPMGFEHDLLEAFADANDLEFRVRVVREPDSLFPRLRRGDGDIAAGRLFPDTVDTRVRFTRALYETPPVIVQAENGPDLPDRVDEILEEGREALDAPPPHRITEDEIPEGVEVHARIVERPEDLEGRTVFLPEGSPHEPVLIEISDELTGDIYVVELDEASAEALIQNVANRRVDLMVTQENIARLKAERFGNLIVRPTLGDAIPVAWAVRPGSDRLYEELDSWLAQPETRQLIDQLYDRYYFQRSAYRERVESEYLSTETGHLSPYDHLFQEHAPHVGWDWRLLASLAYQESLFQPQVSSWAGAQGLLQLMPPTAREFGVTNAFDPADNVAGGVRFIEWLYDYWEDIIPDEEQRLRFVLASYNTGHGHVEDARRLADHHDMDDTQWEDVAFWLLQKSNPEVYRHPVVRFGFSRGLEPVTYVAIILERFDHYRQFVVDGAEVAPGVLEQLEEAAERIDDRPYQRRPARR